MIMNKMGKRHLLVLGGVLLMAICRGETDGPVTVRAVMVGSSPDEKASVVYLQDRTPVEPLPIGNRRFSEKFQLSREKPWVFGFWTNVAGSKAFQEECRIDPPAASSVWLVFHQKESEALSDGGETSASLSVQVLDSSAVQEGGVAVLNLSDAEIEAEIREQTSSVEAGRQWVMTPGGEMGDRYAVRFHMLQNGRKRPFVTTNWFLGEKRRRLAVILDEPGRTVPKLIAIDEIDARSDDSGG